MNRTIVAVDIEGSTARSNPTKGELRRALYDLLGRALEATGITARHLEPFTDRGDGVLILIRPYDDVPKTLVSSRLMPILAALLAEHNASAMRPELQMRLRAAVHAGEVHEDGAGFYGEGLDIAFRLLNAPALKKALKEAPGAPLILVFSETILEGIIQQDPCLEDDAYRPLVRVRSGSQLLRGWVHIPAPLQPYTPFPGRRPDEELSPPLVLASVPSRSPDQPEGQSALVVASSAAVPAAARAASDIASPAVPDSTGPTQSVSLAAVYQAAERRQAETGEPFDTEAGLARLEKWMPADQAEPRAERIKERPASSLDDLHTDPLQALTPSQLARALRQYWIWAGKIPYRELARRSNGELAISTISVMLRSETLPSLGRLLAFVSACGAGEEDRRRFVTAWRRISLGQDDDESPPQQTPASRPAAEGPAVPRHALMEEQSEQDHATANVLTSAGSPRDRVSATAALSLTTAAIQLSNTVIGHIRLRRPVTQAEAHELRRWLEEQLTQAMPAADPELRLSHAAQDAIGGIWDHYRNAIARQPAAEHYLTEVRDRSIEQILRHLHDF